jgi:hypothetical protein
MRTTPAASIIALAAAFLGGCSSGSQNSPAMLSALPSTPMSFRAVPAKDAAKTGIYVSAFDGTAVYGFASDNRKNRAPICSVDTGKKAINDVGVDGDGNLVIPEGRRQKISVYKGPDMCGSELGSMHDPYGQPAAAASFNAATGMVVVANIEASNREQIGNIAICTLKGGCTKKLANPNITGPAIGVALAKNGDCWLVSNNASRTAGVMTYWPRCTGHGEAVTGFQNSSDGSLSVDKHGYLVSVDHLGGTTGWLWVYSGCNPACELVGGPFPLEGRALFGALNAAGDAFGATELTGAVDIYKYSPTELTYEYSFSSGFDSSDYPEGFAYSPGFKQ